MNSLKKIEAEVAAWPDVTVHGHRFGGREFRFGRAEIGHVHLGGTVDIPFPRAIHDALLRDGLAQEHRWVPNSGWITFVARDENDSAHAVWLLRLSWLRYALKEAPDPRTFLERESHSFHLGAEFAKLLEPFLPNESLSDLAR